MRIEIDQSWKIERTNRDTIIAFSNEEKASLRIPAKVKRSTFVYLEEKFGRTKLNVFRIFAAGIVLLIAKSKIKVSNIELIIDLEYPGRDEEIRSMVVGFGSKIGLNFDATSIHFARVGKESPAHFLSYGVHSDKQKETFTATLHELTEILP